MYSTKFPRIYTVILTHPRVNNYDIQTLPITAMYGGNASGKSNFVQALAWSKDFITQQTQLHGNISIQPFLLDENTVNSPTEFSYEILIDNTMYEFTFAVSATEVIEEKLTEISQSGETVLYHRHDNEIDFGSNIEDEQRLRIIFEGTKDNQLFLNNSVDQKVNTYKFVYTWFNEILTIIDPSTSFAFESISNSKVASDFYTKLSKHLQGLDTGISQFKEDIIPVDSYSDT